MVKRTPTTDDAILFMDDVCLARVERIKTGIILGTFVGYDSTAVVAKVFDELEQELAMHETIIVYFDALVIWRLTTKTKSLAIEWGQSHRGRVDGSVLIASSVAEMALRIVTRATAMPIRIYSNQAPFLASIRCNVPEFRHLPVVDPQLLQSH